MILRKEVVRRILRVMVGLFVLGSAPAQAAGDPPALAASRANPALEVAAHAEYLLDASDSLRYQDIIHGRLPFQRHTRNSFQFSFKKATLWFKCRIAAPHSDKTAELSNRRLFLVFDNAALGSITLWVPVVKDGVPGALELAGGWQQDKKSGEFPFLYPTFLLPGNIDDSRPVIVRVATPFSLQFRATLYTVDAFRENSFILFLIIGFCTGILVAMLLYNLVLYLFLHDKHYLYYILYVSFLLVWQCVLFGLFGYFWPSIGALLMTHIAVFASGMMLFAITFAIVFLDTTKTAPRHDIGLKILAACMLILILLSVLRQLWIANLLAYLIGQIVTIVLFTSAVSSLRSGFKPAMFYLIAVGVLLGSAVIFLFKFYGLIPNNTFTMHIMIFGSAAESILLSFALGNRFRILQQEETTLRENEKVLQAISVTDELTGLFNRRFLNASLVKKIAAARRSSTRLSLLMIDVDHFKNFNDTYGHPEGDKALAALGRLLTGTLREEDIACRYGGEEFVTILHNADRKAALEAAERIRSGFEQIIFTPGGGKTIHLTVSIGAAELLPEESPERLLFRADQALYQAKQTGRNRICSA
ncbi:MAG: sensor domain-containing diguanylate cyclase [Deltaproteobacteria bacterium]